MVRYQRDKKTMLAPAELKRVHPLGKSPVIEDGGKIFAETGLIVEYLVETLRTRIWRRRAIPTSIGVTNIGCITPKAR